MGPGEGVPGEKYKCAGPVTIYARKRAHKIGCQKLSLVWSLHGGDALDAVALTRPANAGHKTVCFA